MAFDIDKAVYQDTVIKDGQQIPRFYIPVFDDTVMFVVGKKPFHPEFAYYNKYGNVKDYMHVEEISHENMTEKLDTIGPQVIVIVECRIPSGTILTHSKEESQTVFADGFYTIIARKPTRFSGWDELLFSYQIFHQGDAHIPFGIYINKTNMWV